MPTGKPNKAGSGKKKRGAPRRYRCPVIRVTLCIPQDGKNELIQQAERIAWKYLREGQQARPRVKGSGQGQGQGSGQGSKVGNIGSGQAMPPQATGQATGTDKSENRVCIPILPGANGNPESGVLLPGDIKK